MGIIPTPFVSGANCALCYDVPHTPLHFKCFFGAISRGDLWNPGLGMPPNGYYDITNSDEFACIWTRGAPPWPQIRFILQDGVSTLACKPTFAATAFSGRVFENCKYHFTNLLQGPAGNAFYGGYGMIITPDEMATMINSFTPMIDPDPRMECFPMTDEYIAIRYAGKRDATNIMIKIDTNP